jgi:thiol-disulfide isomerase/thioredoxin
LLSTLQKDLKMRRFAVIALVLAAIAGCNRGEDSDGPIKVSATELKEEISSREDRIVVVNFWATWCLPCREEFPDFVRFGKEFEAQGVDVVFVSADFEPDVEMVSEFLSEHEVPWQSYLKTGNDFKFISSFHDGWSGGLPATFIFDRSGELRAFWEGKSTFRELEHAVLAVM